MKALKFGEVTCVGFFEKEFPHTNGNCFSVKCDDGEWYHIVNFCYENLNELTKRGVGFPFDVVRIADTNVALIDDARIPYNWYSTRYCTVCCPEEYLLENQRMENERQRRRGERVESDVLGLNGIPMRMITMISGKRPDVRTQEEKDNLVKEYAKRGIKIVGDI